MIAFSNTVHPVDAGRFLAPFPPRITVPAPAPKRASNHPDGRLARKIEAGLDRLLSDIERLEDVERWDGLS